VLAPAAAGSGLELVDDVHRLRGFGSSLSGTFLLLLLFLASPFHC
jgi:hypothetical protein